MAVQQKSIFEPANIEHLQKLVQDLVQAALAERENPNTPNEPNGRYAQKTNSSSEEIEAGQFVRLVRQKDATFRLYWQGDYWESSEPITSRKNEAHARMAYDLIEHKASQIWGRSHLIEDSALLTLFMREVLDAVKRLD